MNQPNKLLVITNDHHMSDTQRTELTTRAKLIAEKVGAELLVLGPGQGADLINGPLMPGKATADEIKEGLRNCSASRGAYFGSQLNSGVLDYDHLKEAIAKQHDRLFQILKRVEDTGALLYRWDRAGVPAAHVESGLDVSRQKDEATTAQLREELAVSVEPLAAVEGMALSYCLGPLESAIESTARVMRDERERVAGLLLTTLTGEFETGTLKRLSEHLDALLAEQLKRVTADE